MRKIVLAMGTILTLIALSTSNRIATASNEELKISVPPMKVETKGDVYKVRKRIVVFVTAYYGPCKDQGSYANGSYEKDIRINGSGKETRAGTVPKIGTAAADWRVLPKGTKFRIPDCDVILGDKSPRPIREIVFEVLDTGGAVKGKHVDIFTGFGDQGCKIAKNFDCKRFVIEVIE